MSLFTDKHSESIKAWMNFETLHNRRPLTSTAQPQRQVHTHIHSTTSDNRRRHCPLLLSSTVHASHNYRHKLFSSSFDLFPEVNMDPCVNEPSPLNSIRSSVNIARLSDPRSIHNHPQPCRSLPAARAVTLTHPRSYSAADPIDRVVVTSNFGAIYTIENGSHRRRAQNVLVTISLTVV